MEVPFLEAGFRVISSGQVVAFSIPLCLANPRTQMFWARQKSWLSFLNECSWSLVLPNVFALLKDIFQKCGGKLGKRQQ